MDIKSKKIGIRNIFLIKSHFNKYTRFKIKKRRNHKEQKCKIKILSVILFIMILLFCERFIIYKSNNKFNNNNFNIKFNNMHKYQQDDLTIVSAYYKIKSKYKPEKYYEWLHNFALFNKSMVFFLVKNLCLHSKN